MRPYDGKEHKYTSNDLDRDKAIGIISNILGFRPNTESIDYSLNFYSGGTGIDDRLGIRCQIDRTNFQALIAKLNLKNPSEAIADQGWAEDFFWLVNGDDPKADVCEICCKFINLNKHSFQDIPTPTSHILFSHESDVNHWCVVWLANDFLNYLYFDQG